MGEWHQDPDKDVPSRRIIIAHIVKLLEHCKPSAFSGKQEKLVDLARRLEVALYKASKSKKEYLDTKTLRQRVRQLAQLSSVHQSSSSKEDSSRAVNGAAGKTTDSKTAAAEKTTSTPDKRSDANGGASKMNGGASGATGRTLTTDEQRMRILKQRQQRLLLLRHASKCPLPEGRCKIPPCAGMKRLWKHIAKCKDQKCQVPHCVSSRYVLSHYHRCKDKKCAVCAPVRKISEEQRQRRIERQQAMMKQQAKLGGKQRGKSSTKGRKPQGRPPKNGVDPRPRASAQQHSSAAAKRAAALRAASSAGFVIKKQYSRSCISGTGPSLTNYLTVDNINAHVEMIKADRLYNICWPLVRKLMEHRNNRGLFNEPVDTVALNIPEYNKIVRKPIDLGTIRSKLEAGKFKSLKDFCGAVRLVFKNAMSFNPSRHPVHEIAQQMLELADAEIPKLEQKRALKGKKSKSDKACPMCHAPECETCPICEMGCVTFEPRLLYCAKCEKKIGRNAVYYAGVGYLYAWCHDCYDKSRGDEVAAAGGTKRFKKKDLVKKKNNELFAEPWVSCDRCECWLHQTCGLFNARKNDEKWKSVPYLCPLCQLKDAKEKEALEAKEAAAARKRGGRDTRARAVKSDDSDKDKDGGNDRDESKGSSADEAKKKDGDNSADAKVAVKSEPGKETDGTSKASDTKDADAGKSSEVAKKDAKDAEPGKKSFVPAAKDLEHTRLGKFLENWVQKSMKEKYEDEVENPPKFDSGVKPTEPAHTRVRVLHNYDETFKVEPYVRSAKKDFPDSFTYRSRCIFLFQEQNGVDVLLFAMYVQEYGTNTADPNKRKVYIAYLDSVHYFKPRRMRTLVYHSLLTAYLEYSRRRGFTSAYIWACPPPNKRDDYILHCHPEDQRVPSAERLRKWYHEMIKMANKESIVVSSCPLYDEHFVPNGPSGKGKGKKSGKGKGKGKGAKGRKSPTPSAKSGGRGTRSNRRGGATATDDGAAEDSDGVEKEEVVEYFGPPPEDVEKGLFIAPANGVLSADPWTMPSDLEKRKTCKLALNCKMPYFKGDYWPQEAEECAKEIEAKLRKESIVPPKPVFTSTGRASRKRRRPGEETEAEEKERLAAEAAKKKGKNKGPKIEVPKERLVSKLSSQLELNRDNFLVVKLAHECARCGEYLLRGRWECRNPRCCTISPNFDTPAPFAICNACYIEECKRPEAHQHGGGCIAKGKRGKPKEEAFVKKMDEGKDQTIVNIPKAQAEAFKKKRDALKTSVLEKLQAREAAARSGKASAGKASAGKTAAGPNKAGGAKKVEGDGKIEKSDVPEVKKEETTTSEDAKASTKQEEPGKTEPGVASAEVKKEACAPADQDTEMKDSEDVKSSTAKSESNEGKKAEKTEGKEKSAPDGKKGNSGATKTDAADKGKKEFSNIKVDRNLYQKELAPALAKLLVEFRNETKKAYHENLKEWDKLELRCERPIADVNEDSDSHELVFVDDNMPVETPYYDRPMQNPLLVNRHAFLALCTGNRYQFDELRRAKHSTMMTLYHLHNPKAPAHLYTCNMCNKDILGQQRFHCDICQGGDFDICRACYAKHGHVHKLIPIQITTGVDLESNEAQRIQRQSEQRRARQRSLQLFLQALVHSSYCTKSDCHLAACRKMKELLQHRKDCEVRVRGGCEVCRRVLCLVQMHSKSCTKKGCPVPHCEDLKQHLARQEKQRKAKLRKANKAKAKGKKGPKKVTKGKGRGKATVVATGGTKIKIKTSLKGSKTPPSKKGKKGKKTPESSRKTKRALGSVAGEPAKKRAKTK